MFFTTLIWFRSVYKISILKIRFCIHFWIKWELWKTFDRKMIGWTHFSDLKSFANSWPSASNFKSFSRSIEHFFLTVGQNKFGNKIPFLWNLRHFVQGSANTYQNYAWKKLKFKAYFQFWSMVRKYPWRSSTDNLYVDMTRKKIHS